MDNLTHSLLGALIGQAGLKRRTGLAMPALIIGANIPDIDATCMMLGDMQHLALRRGLTHGPVAMLVLPLVLAGGLWWFDRWQARRGKRPDGRLPLRFGWLWALSLIACLSHPAFDWLNSYGVRLLEPFSSRWFYGDTLFIIDLWLWLVMGCATWLSLRRERQHRSWRWPAITGLLISLLYVSWNWTETQGTLINFAINSKVVWEGEKDRDALLRIPTGTVIATPVLLGANAREIIVGETNNWYVAPAGAAPDLHSLRPVTAHRCAWPNVEMLRQLRTDLDAFLFWSRAPYSERAADGSVLIRDARFHDPRARDRFTVALPEVACAELRQP